MVLIELVEVVELVIGFGCMVVVMFVIVGLFVYMFFWCWFVFGWFDLDVFEMWFIVECFSYVFKYGGLLVKW